MTPRSRSGLEIPARARGQNPSTTTPTSAATSTLLSSWQAAVSQRESSRALDAWTAGRQKNAVFYDAAFARADLGGAVQTPPRARRRAPHLQFNMCCGCAIRNPLRQHLMAAGSARRSTIRALHLQKCFAYLAYANGAFPESEAPPRRPSALPILSGTRRRSTAVRGRRGRRLLQALTSVF